MLKSSWPVAEADNKLEGNWEAVLRVQLRKLVESGKLVKPAGKGTYKLGEALKKSPKKKAVSICDPFCRQLPLQDSDRSPSDIRLAPSDGLCYARLTFFVHLAGPQEEGNSHR